MKQHLPLLDLIPFLEQNGLEHTVVCGRIATVCSDSTVPTASMTTGMGCRFAVTVETVTDRHHACLRPCPVSGRLLGTRAGRLLPVPIAAQDDSGNGRKNQQHSQRFIFCTRRCQYVTYADREIQPCQRSEPVEIRLNLLHARIRLVELRGSSVEYAAKARLVPRERRLRSLLGGFHLRIRAGNGTACGLQVVIRLPYVKFGLLVQGVACPPRLEPPEPRLAAPDKYRENR